MSKEQVSVGQSRIFKHSLTKALSSENSKQLVHGHKLMTMQEDNNVNDTITCEMEVDNSTKGKLQISGNTNKEVVHGRDRETDSNIASSFSKTDEKHLSSGEYTHYNMANSVIFERKINKDPHSTNTCSSELVDCEGDCSPDRRQQKSSKLNEAMKLPDLLQGQATYKDKFDSYLCSNEDKIDYKTSQNEVFEENREGHISIRISLNKPDSYVSGLSVWNEKNILPEKVRTTSKEAHRGEQNNKKWKGNKKSYPQQNSKEIRNSSKAFKRNSKDLNGCFEGISNYPGVMHDSNKVSIPFNESENYVKTSTRENKPYVKNGSTDHNSYSSSHWSRENKPYMKNRSTDYNSNSDSNWSRENKPYRKNRSTNYMNHTRHHEKVNRFSSSRTEFKFIKTTEQSTHSQKIDKSNNSKKVVTRCQKPTPQVHQHCHESQIYLITNSKANDRLIQGTSNKMIAQKIQDHRISEDALDKTVESSKECEVISAAISTDDVCKILTLNVRDCFNEQPVENIPKQQKSDKDLRRVNYLISDIFKSYKSEDLPNKVNKIKTVSNELPISSSLHANKRIVKKKDESLLKGESNNQEEALNIYSGAHSQKVTLAEHDSKDSSIPDALDMLPQDTRCEEKILISHMMHHEVQHTNSGENIQHLSKQDFGEDDTFPLAQVNNECHPSLTKKMITIFSGEKTSDVNHIAQSIPTSEKCSKSSSEFNSCSSEPNSDYEAELCSQSECEERQTPKQNASPDPSYYPPAYPYNPPYSLQNRDWPLHINNLPQGSAHPNYVSNAVNQDRHTPLLLRNLCLPASSFGTQETLEKIIKFLKSCSTNIEEFVRNVSDDHISLDAYVTVSIPAPPSDYYQGLNSLMNPQYSYEFNNSDKGIPASAPFNHSTPATINSVFPPYFQHGFWPNHYSHHLDTSVSYPFGYYDHYSRMTNPSLTQQAPFSNYEYPVPKLDMREEGFNMWMYSHCAPFEAGHYVRHNFEKNGVPPRKLVSSGKDKMTTEVEAQDMTLADANVMKAESHIPQDMNQVPQRVDYTTAKNDTYEGLKKHNRRHSLTDISFDLNESGNSSVDLNDSGSEPLSPPVSALTPKKSAKSKIDKFHPYCVSNYLTPDHLTNDWTLQSSKYQDPLPRNLYPGRNLTASGVMEYVQVSSLNTVEHKKHIGLKARKGTHLVEANSFNKTSVKSSSQNPDSSHGGTWYSKPFPKLATSELSKFKDSNNLSWRERGKPLNPSLNWRDHCEPMSSSEQYQMRRWSSPLPNMSTVCSMIIKNKSDMDKNNTQAFCSDDSTLPSFCYSETNDLYQEIENCCEQKSPRDLGVLDRNFIFQNMLMSRFADPNASQMSKFNEVIKDSAWATDFARRSKLYAHKFIDSHCHIDFLYKQLDLKNISYKKFKEDRSDFFPANYEGCVAVFCNPRTYYSENPKDNIVKLLTNESGVWFTFGCHPKNATEFTEVHEIGLKRFLRHPQVVALGEIGLDYSGMFKQHAEVQKNVFRKQLVLALEMNLPLVIHCRDADDDCLEILIEIVPRSHKIHAHCFTRDIHVAWRWLAPFPNLFLGLTPLITYTTAREAINTAQHIPLDRLLLETDAPYFVPRSSVKMLTNSSYPGLALCTAEKVAEYKGITVDAVLKACRENTTKMYGI